MMRSVGSPQSFTAAWFTALADSAAPGIDRQIEYDLHSGSLTFGEVAQMCALCAELLIRQPTSESPRGDEPGMPDNDVRSAIAAQFAQLAGSIDDSAAAALASQAGRAAVRLLPDGPEKIVLERLARMMIDGSAGPSTKLMNEVIRASIATGVFDAPVDEGDAWPRTPTEFEALSLVGSMAPSVAAPIGRATVREVASTSKWPGDRVDPEADAPGRPEWEAPVRWDDSWLAPAPDTPVVAPGASETARTSPGLATALFGGLVQAGLNMLAVAFWAVVLVIGMVAALLAVVFAITDEPNARDNSTARPTDVSGDVGTDSDRRTDLEQDAEGPSDPKPATTQPGFNSWVTGPDVLGSLGPSRGADGIRFGVVLRDGGEGLRGQLEVLAEAQNGWELVQTVPVDHPRRLRWSKDFDGNGHRDIIVSENNPDSGNQWDSVHLVGAGPSLESVPYELDALQLLVGANVIGIRVSAVPEVRLTTFVECAGGCVTESNRIAWILSQDPRTFSPDGVLPPFAAPVSTTESPPSTTEFTTPVVREGDSGPAVAEAQRLLLDAGFWIGPDGADGSFGPNTARAVEMVSPGTQAPAGESVIDADIRRVLVEMAAEPPQIDAAAKCPARTVIADEVSRHTDEIFRVFDVQCSDGWVLASVRLYDEQVDYQLLFSLEDSSPVLFANSTGPDGVCRVSELSYLAYEYFGCR